MSGGGALGDVAAVAAVRETGEFLGRQIVRYACGVCGHETGSALRENEDLARAELEFHLRAEHLAALGLGECEVCGQVTDWLRAVSELGDSWLCEVHAPAASLRDVISHDG